MALKAVFVGIDKYLWTCTNRISFQSESDACAGSECPQWREHR